MTTYNYFILGLFIALAEGETRQLHLKKLSSTESLNALVCAMDKFGNEESLATRYDLRTDTCEAIPVSEFNGDVQNVFYILRSIRLSTAHKESIRYKSGKAESRSGMIYIEDQHIHDFDYRFDIAQVCDMVRVNMLNDVDVLEVERIYPA